MQIVSQLMFADCLWKSKEARVANARQPGGIGYRLSSKCTKV